MTKPNPAQFHKVFPAELRKDTLVVSPRGDSISFRDSDIDKEIKVLLEILDQPQAKNLVVDLEASRYFGTTIIGAFNVLGTKARDRGGKIALCNASGDMRGILSVMNLDTLWPHYDSLKEALRAVAS
jgi:anti-anti-sigma factor